MGKTLFFYTRYAPAFVREVHEHASPVHFSLVGQGPSLFTVNGFLRGDVNSTRVVVHIS